MREIKFRVWDKVNNCWLEDGNKTYYFLTREGCVFSYYNDGSGGYDCDYLDEDKVVVVFYTGLKDKNGKDIYDNDIVNFCANYTNKPCGWMKGKVVIGEYKLELHAENGEVYVAEEETDEFPYAKCEVIGNIYENENLIK